jgi:hypothetical protein
MKTFAIILAMVMSACAVQAIETPAEEMADVPVAELENEPAFKTLAAAELLRISHVDVSIELPAPTHADLARPLSVFERRAADTAYRGWLHVGLPEVEPECLDDLMVVTTEDDETFDRLTGADATVNPAAIVGRYIVYGPRTGVDYFGEPIIHEVMHRLLACSKLDDKRGDYNHDHPGVWRGRDSNVAQQHAENWMVGIQPKE